MLAFGGAEVGGGAAGHKSRRLFECCYTTHAHTYTYVCVCVQFAESLKRPCAYERERAR